MHNNLAINENQDDEEEEDDEYERARETQINSDGTCKSHGLEDCLLCNMQSANKTTALPVYGGNGGNSMYASQNRHLNQMNNSITSNHSNGSLTSNNMNLFLPHYYHMMWASISVH